MIVRWSGQANADRKAAITYLRQFNPYAAKRMSHALLAESRTLADFPERGRPGNIEGTREIVTVSPFILVYEIDFANGILTILRLWHAAQDR